MKNYCSFYYFQLLLPKKKVYYTEDFKNYLPEGRLLQYLLKNDKEGTTRRPYFIDGTKRNYDQFQISKNVF
jgi:hypothetical protein